MPSPSAHTPETDAGFTIIEVVVASTLLLIAFLAAAGLFVSGTRVSGDTRMRVVAAQLASSAIEAVRGPAADPSKFTTAVQPGTTVTTKTVNGLRFTITQEMQWVAQSSTASACDSGGIGTNGLLQVSESVTWRGAGATAPVKAVTTLAPPAGAYSAATGSVGVKVLNAAGQGLANVAAQVTGPTSRTISTTTEGCAFFAFLTPGSYTVSVVAGTGVGDQEQVVPSQTTSVTVGQTASLTFNYDTAATITVTGWSGSTFPAATNIPIGVANTSLQPFGAYTYAAGSTVLAPLFPYPSGYTVFAGSCTDSNPVGLDTGRNAFYPNPGTVATNVTPGTTSATTVPLYDLPVKVVDSAGNPVLGATITAAETSGYPAPNTAVCMNGGSTGPLPTYGLVASDAAGMSNNAVPLGHLSVRAQKGTKSGTVKIWRRVTGIFNVTSVGARTGSGISLVTVTVT
jgi:prepilin-type N-terminal cleavage/methylation domain-containing protein